MTYSKGDIVKVDLARRTVTGKIIRKQGGRGYIVEYLRTWTTQDFTTLKLTEHTEPTTSYFKTETINGG